MSKRNHKKRNIMASKDNDKLEKSEEETAVEETEVNAESESASEENTEAEAQNVNESVDDSENVSEEAKSDDEAAAESDEEPDDEAEEDSAKADEESANGTDEESDGDESDNKSDENSKSVKSDKAKKDADNSDNAKEKTHISKKASAVEADVRKEAARVAKNKHDRDKAANAAADKDEKREARRKRRVRNQVISYIVVVILVLALIGIGVFAYFTFFGKDKSPETSGNTIEVTESTEQTEDIINDMLGMEDDISEPVVEPTPVEDIPEPEVDLLGEFVKAQIEAMSLEDKVAGIFMVTPESITGATVATIAGDATTRALEKYAVGGILYSSKNVSNKEQFSTLIETTSSLVKYPTFFAFTEEGGSVGSLAQAGYYDAEDSAATIAATADVTNAYSAGITIGFAMNEIGLNVNLAPVADLADISGNVLGNRIYSDSIGDVVGFANEMMDGLEDSKITACLKYFPGLGMVTTNPESGRVTSDRTDEEFTDAEFVIYQTLIDNGANMIMMSNVIYTAYSEVPASLSEEIVSGILRDRLNYDGIIISGNLSDMAVSQYYGSEEAAIYALKAGCDMILCPENFEAAYNGIIKAVNDGVIDEKRIDNALERILRVKYAEDFE